MRDQQAMKLHDADERPAKHERTPRQPEPDEPRLSVLDHGPQKFGPRGMLIHHRAQLAGFDHRHRE